MEPEHSAGDVSDTRCASPSAAESAASSRKKHERHSREETTIRILDAAEELFARRDPSRVTVREIAEAAGVTHPLVHEYMGSKSDILEAVVSRRAPHRHRLMLEHPDYREALPLLIEDVLNRKVHTMAVVRSAMDAVEYVPMGQREDSGRMLIALAEQSVALGRERLPDSRMVDPRIGVAAAIALVYGWTALEQTLLSICDLTQEDPVEVHRQMMGIFEYVADLVHAPATI